MNKKTIALVGNPNVGKTTLFNAITGMHQHTGNWAGKTVSTAIGKLKYEDYTLEFIDLPGAYSLNSDSPDEIITSEYIKSNDADIILIIVDATCIQRNLLLVHDVLAMKSNVILCLNLMDEAKRKGITIDINALEDALNLPVIPVVARAREGLDLLLASIASFNTYDKYPPRKIEPAEVYNRTVELSNPSPHKFDRKLDKILTSRVTGYPIMILLLIIIFWLTMVGANYPSAALSSVFESLDSMLRSALYSISMPEKIISLIMDGLYSTVAWVVSVMLPPMAIFFPLFTLLEDSGYLPRIAFNLDNVFKKSGTHGKQALTMCMGLGCNACGIMGCRIIDSPKERLIAILTNCFTPCNGRFPMLITIILVFFAGVVPFATSFFAGILLTFFLIVSVLTTLLVSKFLSKTILKGIPSAYILELPSYRLPKIGSVIVRSVLDRTIFVLARAVIVAAPAGIIIWVLANINIGDVNIITILTDFLNPFGKFIGVDGVILAAFILGLPANEIVLPIMLMCYMSKGQLTDFSSLTQLQTILIDCGWTIQTALSVIILCLFHFPCGTTLLTIKKETSSLKWVVISIILPAVVGISLCFILNIIVELLYLL